PPRHGGGRGRLGRRRGAVVGGPAVVAARRGATVEDAPRAPCSRRDAARAAPPDEPLVRLGRSRAPGPRLSAHLTFAPSATARPTHLRGPPPLRARRGS